MANDLLKEQDLRTSTPQRWRNEAVDSFDDIGLACALGTWPVLPAGQHFGVGLPRVGEGPAVAVIPLGQGLPKLAQRGFSPAAQRPAHDAPPGALDGEP